MSLITLTDSDFHDPLEQLLHELTERVDAVVDRIASESQQFRRHEEYTTSRLAQAINDAIRNHQITAPGLALDVHAEEFTKPQEKVAGADLYISVVRKDTQISKGILVQTKRREAMLRSGEPQRLGNQCKQMRRRSKKSSYVWIYEDDHVLSVKAPQASNIFSSALQKLHRLANSLRMACAVTEAMKISAGNYPPSQSKVSST